MANKVLGARLTEAAARAGFRTRQEIGVLLGILQSVHGVDIKSIQAVQYWLSGDRTPEPPHLVALLDALGVYGDERKEIMRIAYPALQAMIENREPPTPPEGS